MRVFRQIVAVLGPWAVLAAGCDSGPSEHCEPRQRPSSVGALAVTRGALEQSVGIGLGEHGLGRHARGDAHNIDILSCPKCDGRLRLMAVVRNREQIRRFLTHLGMHPDPPPVAKARDPAFEFAA